MPEFNLIREIRELKSQLSYSKRYGFFFGAGTSCALGVPNIAALTTAVAKDLKGTSKNNFDAIKSDLETTFPERTINIEDILNHLRQIRTLTGGKKDKAYLKINGVEATKLDDEICRKIYTIISDKEDSVDITGTKQFFAWLNMQNNTFAKELFTTNYDLIFEKALEEIRAPYFDGFVGSYEPFFWQESIERFVDQSDLTQNWLRLWKIHGSLNWFWKTNGNGTHSIIRGGKISSVDCIENELVIYPSKEKYESSRKQPFIAYFDRLKNYLTSGELLFIFSGYSFSDQHINEIVFNSLRQNNRLTVIVFFYLDSEVEELYKTSSSYLNLTAYGPTKAIINGTLGEWKYNKSDLKPHEKSDTYWDSSSNKLIIGDFAKLIEFFLTNSGKRDTIEAMVNEQ